MGNKLSGQFLPALDRKCVTVKKNSMGPVRSSNPQKKLQGRRIILWRQEGAFPLQNLSDYKVTTETKYNNDKRIRTFRSYS